MRSQRRGRRRLGRRGRRREESSAKVDAWRRGEGSGEREAGRAFGCLSTRFIIFFGNSNRRRKAVAIILYTWDIFSKWSIQSDTLIQSNRYSFYHFKLTMTHREMRSRRREEEMRLVQRTKDLDKHCTIAIEIGLYY